MIKFFCVFAGKAINKVTAEGRRSSVWPSKYCETQGIKTVSKLSYTETFQFFWSHLFILHLDKYIEIDLVDKKLLFCYFVCASQNFS